MLDFQAHFAGDMILYLENSKESTSKLTELITGYSGVGVGQRLGPSSSLLSLSVTEKEDILQGLLAVPSCPNPGNAWLSMPVILHHLISKVQTNQYIYGV